jgi:hypothetical protein
VSFLRFLVKTLDFCVELWYNIGIGLRILTDSSFFVQILTGAPRLKDSFMFKAILLSVFMLVSFGTQAPALAGPAQQEKLELCRLEALAAVQGLGAMGLSKEEFNTALKGLVDSAENDPEMPKPVLRAIEKGLRLGYAGIEPQKVFDTCMALKQAGN